jgi:hypothetical protein
MINTAQKISQKVVSGRDFYVDKNYYVFSFDFYPQEEFTSKTEVFYHEGKCPFTSSLAKKSQVHLENKRLAYQIPFTYLLKSKSSNQEESFLCIKVDASLTNERKKIEHFGVPLLNLHYLKLAPDKSEPQLKPLAVDKIRPFQEKQCTDTTCTWFFQIDFRRLSELYEGGEKFSIAYTLGVNPDNLKTENLIFRDAFFLSNTERKPFELWSSSNEFEYIYRIYNLEYLFKKVFQELHLSVIKDAKSFGQIDLSLVIK